MRLRAVYPNHITRVGVGHICTALGEHLGHIGVPLACHVAAADRETARPFMRLALPRPLERVAYRFVSRDRLHARTEDQFLRAIEPGEIAYIWPNTSVRTCERLKARGHTVVTECVNCHSYTKVAILDEAYARLGWVPQEHFTPKAIQTEARRIALADFVFAPNACVAQSMLDAGIPDQRVLRVSYGWDPARMSGRDDRSHHSRSDASGVTVVFVGRVCVRKGAHLLLRAWAEANIRGRLFLFGTIDAELRQHMAEHLDRPDVVCRGFVNDVAPALRSADVFAFPSLEEGGPLVTHEAMACGLPVLVSPMGAGAAARDGEDGYVIDPYAHDAWVEKLRLLAHDGALRRELGRSAAIRARQFTWAQVAQRRADLLAARVGVAE